MTRRPPKGSIWVYVLRKDGSYAILEIGDEMKDLSGYLKYYFLEDYLFGEVNKNFKKRGYLTPEEFLAIVIWKSNRAKTNVLKGVNKNGKTINKITSDIAHAKTPQQKLETLTSIPGIGIPMASAILTVCYPNDFTIELARRSKILMKP